MKLLRPALQLFILGGLAFVIWYYFFPPPERVIRQSLADLAATNPKGFAKVVAMAAKANPAPKKAARSATA